VDADRGAVRKAQRRAEFGADRDTAAQRSADLRAYIITNTSAVAPTDFEHPECGPDEITVNDRDLDIHRSARGADAVPERGADRGSELVPHKPAVWSAQRTAHGSPNGCTHVRADGCAHSDARGHAYIGPHSGSEHLADSCAQLHADARAHKHTDAGPDIRY